MGLSLEFLVGDKRSIVNAIDKENFEVTEKLDESGMSSDLSLHISLDDLDVLFQVIAIHVGKSPINFRKNLDTTDCFCDHPDRGAFFVRDAIKIMVAQCSEDEAKLIATKWYEKLSLDHSNEQLGNSSDAEDGLTDLIRICKVAIKENLDLVHWWVG